MNLNFAQHGGEQICVVMGTYNGVRFVEQQIESIFDQTCGDWSLLVRDDKSSDQTWDILSRYEQDRLTIVKAPQRQGVIQNFNELLLLASETSSRYIALADQDDIWNREKLSQQLSLMQQLETEDPDQPILIHSDLEVVDETLGQIAPSFMRYQGIRDEEINPLQVLLVQNYVTGCTVLINRPLLEVSLPVPDEALMHDWWLALCAAVFGKIACIEAPLVRYRQHGNNQVGAKHIKSLLNPFRNNYYQLWNAGRQVLVKSIAQAQVLADRVRHNASESPDLPVIEAYAQLQQTGSFCRVKKIHDLRIHSQSKLRHQLMLSRLINIPCKRAA